MFQLIVTALAAVLVVVDQIVKSWAANVLVNGEIAVIDKVLYLKYTENTGVAFSMFSDKRWVLVAITGLMLAAVLVFFLSGKVTDKFEIISLALIMAGGVGNLIDRIKLGYVIDFIDVRIINFAIFNVADICITVGAALLCISFFLAEKKANAQKKTLNTEDERGENEHE